jgi:hypothetical protein
MLRSISCTHRLGAQRTENRGPAEINRQGWVAGSDIPLKERTQETISQEPIQGTTRKTWRRGSESNRRIKVLQTSPLPLGYRASASKLAFRAEKVHLRRADWEAKNLERETGVEPATSTLARSRSTTELLPLVCSFYSTCVWTDNSRVGPAMGHLPISPSSAHDLKANLILPPAARRPSTIS